MGLFALYLCHDHCPLTVAEGHAGCCHLISRCVRRVFFCLCLGNSSAFSARKTLLVVPPCLREKHEEVHLATWWERFG